ncbi:hypothetical protein Pelo_1559 [Pelomyxa schiedti]|nr:hypothetical protein Pelo_1559 [Pelomyxa schiedti]
MTTPLSEAQRQAMIDACRRGDMPTLPPSPTWDINTPISDGGLPILHIACGCGHESVVGQLLGVGASRNPPIDPNKTDGDGETPLCLAAGNGNEAVVRLLVARPDVDVNKACPLAHACWLHRMGVVVALLECPRVDVNLVPTTGYGSLIGQTALHVACEERFVEGVKVLLQVNGIDINCKNNQGKTPLDVATRRNCTDICNLLKDHNARRIVQSSKSTTQQQPQSSPTTIITIKTAPTTTTRRMVQSSKEATMETLKKNSSTFTELLEMREKEIVRITGENKRLGDSLREMNERVLILEGKLQEKERRILTLEEENSVLKASFKERAETMTSLVGANIDSFAMMKFLGSGSNAATFQVRFFPSGGGGGGACTGISSSSVPQLHHLLHPSSPSPPTTTQPPLDNNNNNTNKRSEENNAPQSTTMAMKVLFNWENTPQQTLIKQKYMKECIVLASVPLHPNVIHPLGTLVIPRFPPEFIEAIPSDQPVYKELSLNKSLAFLLPFCGVPLVKFLTNLLDGATTTSTTTTSTPRIVRNMLLQSLSAVCHLERAHVVHRDIKGDNILVDPATHKLTLIDFGEAVECLSTDGCDDDLQAIVMRTDGQVWGNTGTMPPEVSALSRDLMRMRGPSCVFSFAKCDSFSLALTFYDAMLPPTNKFIGQFKQGMCTFTPEFLPPLPPHWDYINNGLSNTTTATTATARTENGTSTTMMIGQVLVGMMSRDRATRLSASVALNSFHSSV